MSGAPRISIGMPVYNGAEFLDEALGDLAGQTFTDFELIISDNASTDATPQICRRWVDRDPRIRYHREDENHGACWNHNHVVDLATGEYFKFAAHDDRHAPTYLERCVQALDAHPDVVWSHTISSHIGPDGGPLDGPNAGIVGFAASSVHPSWRLPTRESPRAHERFRAVLLGPGGNKDVFGLIRRDAIQRAAPMIPYYGMDKVLVAELSLMGRYHEVPEVLFFGRIHAHGSGALRSARDQQRFIDPLRTSRAAHTRLRLLQGHLNSVRRARLPIAEKLKCYQVLGQYLLQTRKWRSVIERTLSGKGTGGAYVAPLERVGHRPHPPTRPDGETRPESVRRPAADDAPMERARP